MVRIWISGYVKIIFRILITTVPDSIKDIKTFHTSQPKSLFLLIILFCSRILGVFHLRKLFIFLLFFHEGKG